jgi:hypothetical protein
MTRFLFIQKEYKIELELLSLTYGLKRLAPLMSLRVSTTPMARSLLKVYARLFILSVQGKGCPHLSSRLITSSIDCFH